MNIRTPFALIAALMIAVPVHAQGPVSSVAMFDFEETNNEIELIVAMQPNTVFALVQSKDPSPEHMLQTIASSSELIVAYVEDHTELRQGDAVCAWYGSLDPVPQMLLDADAEGITVRGTVECPQPHKAFTLHTDLFTDAIAHQNMIRYKDGDQFTGFAILDRSKQIVTVDLSGVYEKTIGDMPGTKQDEVRATIIAGTCLTLLVLGGVALLVRKNRLRS